MINQWIRRVMVGVILLLLPLSIWTLFLPDGGYGILRFSVILPAWLIAIALVVFVGIIEEG